MQTEKLQCLLLLTCHSILAVTGCETASAEIEACSCTDMRRDCAARATAGTFAPPPYVLVLPRKPWLSVAWHGSALCAE